MFVGSSGPPMDIHRAHNHPSINSVAPGTRIEISIRETSCSQSLRVRISAAERTGIGQPEVVDTLDAFPTALLLSLRRYCASQFRRRNYAREKEFRGGRRSQRCLENLCREIY